MRRKNGMTDKHELKSRVCENCEGTGLDKNDNLCSECKGNGVVDNGDCKGCGKGD